MSTCVVCWRNPRDIGSLCVVCACCLEHDAEESSLAE